MTRESLGEPLLGSFATLYFQYFGEFRGVCRVICPRHTRRVIFLLFSSSTKGLSRGTKRNTLLATMAFLLLSVITTIFLSRSALSALVTKPATISTTVKPTGNFDVECNGDIYGRNLKLLSCASALRQIPTSDRELTFGLRGRLGVDVVTPWRWISCEYWIVTCREAVQR